MRGVSAIEANRLIGPAYNSRELIYPEGDTQDIVRVVVDVEKSHRHELKAFSRIFLPTKAGLKALWEFVKYNIEYQEDPDPYQYVQTPAHLWATRKGDCKSFTVFICAVLHNLGIPYQIKFVSYHKRNKNVTHVYPVAVLEGEEIILDAVWHSFNQEKVPYYHPIKINRMAQVYKLSGVGAASAVKTYEQEIDQILASIPDSVIYDGPGDITQMTAGEFERWQTSQLWDARAQTAAPQQAEQLRAAAKALRRGSVAGIGALDDAYADSVNKILVQTKLKAKPAFEPLDLMVAAGIRGGVADFFKNLGAKVKEAWSKIVNWVFKGPAREVGPYFLFLFTSSGEQKGEVAKRLVQQTKVFGWLEKVGKFDRGQLMREFAAGIVDKFGKTPTEIIAEAKAGIVPGVGSISRSAFIGTPFLVVAVSAIRTLIEIIQKVSALFKKDGKDAGEIREQYASDPALLKAQQETTKPPAQGEGSGMTTPLLLAALGAGLFLF